LDLVNLDSLSIYAASKRSGVPETTIRRKLRNKDTVIQPLDISVFKGFKSAWSKVVDSETPTSSIRQEFYRIFYKFWTEEGKNTISRNIHSGFVSTGLHPIDRDQCLKKLIPIRAKPVDDNATNVSNPFSVACIQPAIDPVACIDVPSTSASHITCHDSTVITRRGRMCTKPNFFINE